MGVAAAVRAVVAATTGALLVTASISSAASSALPRSTTDRPDTVKGPQIHAKYVLPADGVDRALDIDGTIGASVANWQRWFRGQTATGCLRLDMSASELDISFRRLGQTDAQLAGRGVFIRDAIEQELRSVGAIRPDKIYAVYYDGSSTAACGGGAWPPTLPGAVGAVYLRATFSLEVVGHQLGTFLFRERSRTTPAGDLTGSRGTRILPAAISCSLTP